MILRKSSTLLIFAFYATVSLGQEEVSPGDIITDRPDETEAPNLLLKGNLQVETGVFYEKYTEEVADKELFGYNTTLLRYGLLENLEFRLGFDYIKTRTNNSETSYREILGFSPLLLGAKIGIAEENGALPQIGILGHLHLPLTVADDYRPKTTGVDFRFAFSHQLSPSSSLSYNLGAEWKNDESQATYIYTLAYGYSISDRLGIYAEVYGEVPEEDVAGHSWDGGFTYLVKDNLQLDVLVGSEIENSQKLLLGGGVSFRLPN